MITRPHGSEYVPMAQKYVDLVPEGCIIELLAKQVEEYEELLSKLTEDEGNYRYAPDKWTIKTVIGHIADVERLWGYRILRIARGDARELPGYDRDVFAQCASLDRIPLVNVLKDYRAVRASTISLLKNLPEEATTRVGQFNDHILSVRASAYIIAGHERHHLDIIKDRYLSTIDKLS